MNENLKNIDLKFEPGQRIFYIINNSKGYAIQNAPIDRIRITLREGQPPSIILMITNTEFTQGGIYATIEEANEQAIADLAAKRLNKNKNEEEDIEDEDFI